MFARERVADPPIEGHLAVTCRRGSEPPFEVYIPRTVGIARWQRARRVWGGGGGGGAAGAAFVQRSWRRRAPGEGSGSVSYSFRVEVGCQQPRTGLFHKNTKLTTQINKTGTIKTHTLRFILVIIIVFQRDNTLEKSTSGFGRVSVRLSAIVSKIKHSES